MLQFRQFPSIEGSAGAGEKDFFDLFPPPAALQALEDGGMLAVHRHDLRAIAVGGGHHQLPGADQGLLVGKGDALALPDGGQGGLQPHHAHDGGEDGVGLGQRGRRQQPLLPREDLRLRVRQADAELRRRLFVRQNGQVGMKLPHLPLHPLHAGVGRQGCHAQPQLPDHVQGLAADGAGGTQYRNGIRHSLVPIPEIIPAAPPGGTQRAPQRSHCQSGPAPRRGPAGACRNPSPRTPA